MMNLDPTPYTIAAIALWAIGMFLFLTAGKHRTVRILAHVTFLSGIIVLAGFTWILWQDLGRPPMRTLGETRLWYALFLPAIGYTTYIRWNYKWILHYSGVMAIVFLMINLMRPDVYDRDLMPALQSIWFVPHVIVYMFAYAVLAVSAIVAVKGLWLYYFEKQALSLSRYVPMLGPDTDADGKIVPWSMQLADNLVYIGLGFLSLGLLFGALWGKEAWGHYWMWDPKETWAFLTWIMYLAYVHYRHHRPRAVVGQLWVLSLAFIVLLICWFGVNYLPSAANSVHTYTG